MKLIEITYILSFIITYVFSFKINNFKYLNKNEDAYSQLMSCEEIIEKNCNINLDIKKSDLDNSCEVLNSYGCEILLYSGINNFPECQSLSDENSLLLHTSFLIQYKTFSLMCIKDENNDYCPFSLTQLTDSKIKNDTMYIQAIKNNCNSTYCKENTLIHVNDLLTYYEDLENLNYTKDIKANNKGLIKVKEILNSDNCTVQNHSLQYQIEDRANRINKNFIFLILNILITFIIY